MGETVLTLSSLPTSIPPSRTLGKQIFLSFLRQDATIYSTIKSFLNLWNFSFSNYAHTVYVVYGSHTGLRAHLCVVCGSRTDLRTHPSVVYGSCSGLRRSHPCVF